MLCHVYIAPKEVEVTLAVYHHRDAPFAVSLERYRWDTFTLCT